ncbi:hypothetical protein [Thiomicrorhabdus sediminis]|uniref:Uncharacterized protein n=1 Tax=Thiomicrorhabdus sediminis TaxID=2580412 RepID=A0A4P9K6S6_9GAMM|nr:hypothetical protein [Thiomicrorhabdus sediminis]QCU90598.1 hypothetical protein FE785_08100 [Thiomicrorhabdus sediminis]
MSKTKFSADLFEQLGGTHWQVREGVLPSATEQGSGDSLVNEQGLQPKVVQQQALESQSDPGMGNEPISLVAQTEKNANPSLFADEAESFTEQQVETVVESIEEPLLQAEGGVQKGVVLIGQDLESYWQNEEAVEWQLWQNIMQVFGWDEAGVQFYDTRLMVSEDMVFGTIEEIIDSGCEWVLSMDDEHPLSEQLSEGLQVVSVPDFEDMFADPFAKKTFYQTVLGLMPELAY